MANLTNKVAVVTGASKGIGAAIAKGLAAAGAAVVVNYASSREGADKVVAAITREGGKAIAVQGDVSKVEDVKRLFAATKESFGKLDILVNNAGVFDFKPIEEFTVEEFYREYNINVLGTFLTIQEAQKYFSETGGSIINLSSVVSKNPPPHASLYASTKGAIDTLTISLAKELGARKIRVNSLAPGGTETEGTHSTGIIGSDFEKAMVASTPLGRIGQPEDIARVAVFLASDESGWITGDRVTVSGGL